MNLKTLQTINRSWRKMFYFLATILLFAAKSQAQTVAISGLSPLGVNIGPSDSFVVLQCYQLTVTGSSATLTGLSVSTAGTLNATDLVNLQCWYSTTSTFGLVASPGDLSSAYTLLSTKATPGAAGSITFPSFVSQTIPTGTSYIFVTATTASTANTTRTVSIGSTAFSNFSLGSATLTGTNPVPASNTMSFRPFSDPSPYNLTNGDFTLVGWPNSARAKIYPGNGADGTNTNGVYAGATNANIAFHTISNGDPNFTDTAIGDYVGVYNGTSSTRMMGNPGVANGFVWETTGSNLGEAILGLNTTGRDNIYVSWHSETYQHAAATRGYRVRGMYRTGNSGTWQFMPFTHSDTSDITYTGVGSLSPTYADTAYGPIKLPSTCENLPLVQVRWVYYQYLNGTGARPGISVDSIDVTSTSNTATPSIAISNVDPGTNNLSPGSTNNLLQTFHLAVTTHATTINGLSIPVGGTYTTADINNIKLWYSTSSTFNAGTATLLSTITSPATAGTLAFPSFTKGLPVILGGNYYLYVTCDVSSSGTNGHTIRMNSVPFSDFTFSSGTTTGTNPVPTGSVQTILNSVVTLSQTNPTTTAIAPGTTANVLQTYNMAVANAAAVFSGLTITTTGTYATTDLSNIKLWYSSSSTFSTSTATLLSTISSPATAGSLSFPSFSQTLPIGTGYIYVTTDVTTGAATGNTIGIGSESFGNINLGTASTAGTNPIAAATAQTIENATVTISSTSMSPTTVARSQSNIVLQQYDMVVSGVPAILTGLTFNSAGTYASTDVINFKCWYSTSSTFSTSTATLLSTVASPAAAGAQVFPSFTAQTIPVGTGHIFVTTDIYYAATVGNTISAGTTAFSSINFGTATLAGTNPVAANATMTIKTCTDPTPYNLASGVDYTMTNFPTTSAAGTYPSNMVFHCMDAATPTVTANAYNDYTSSYAFGSQTRINALGANGFGFLNNGTSNAPSYYAATTVGEGVLAINTTSRINVNVSWVAGCTAAGTVYNIRGQYRIGTSGAYTDLPNTSLSQIDYTASSIGSQSFGPITLPTTCENQPVVEIRWIYYAPGGGSATPLSYVTNIDVNSSPAPVPMIAVSSTTPAGGNDGQGATNVLVGGYALAVTNAGATFTGLTIAEAGTVTSSDVTAVKAWYSTSSSFSPGTSTLLSTITSTTGAGTHSFPSFSQALPNSDTAYIYVTADLSSSATIGNYIKLNTIPLTDFTFASDSISGSTSASNNQTIVAPPTVAVSSYDPAAATVHDGQTNVQIQRINLAVSSLPAPLNGLKVTTAGTYVSADLTNLKCWYSNSSTFDSTSATLISTYTAPGAAGTKTFPSFTAETLPIGTKYLFITANFSTAAISGHTFSLAADSLSTLDLSGAIVSGTNPMSASNTFTISVTDPSPYNLLTNGTYTFNSWSVNAPAGTYPANMMFHYMNATDPTATASPQSDYFKAYNLVSGGNFMGTSSSSNHGFRFWNQGGGNIGEAVLALNTSGLINIQPTWTAGCDTIYGARRYSVKAQYRIGTSGSYTDVSTDSTQMQFSSTGATIAATTFNTITLPTSCENQPIVEIRWLYFYNGSATGARPALYLTNVAVAGNLPTATISSASTMCVGIGDTIHITSGTPNALVTLNSGDTVTLNGSGTGYIVVNPTTSTTYYGTVSRSGVSSTIADTIALTVLQNPAAIGGPSMVCAASTITLTNATSGGTWTSGATAVATVNAATGVVHGLSAGLTVVTYSNGCGVAATDSITVNPLPAVPSPISGSTNLCVGGTETLTDGVSGGIWHSSNNTFAVVGSSTGYVTAVSAGSLVMSYTISNVCGTNVMTTNFVVGVTPTSITGSGVALVGHTTTLSDGVSGGNWTSSSTSVATIAGGSGIVTGVSAGTPTISYTMGDGCFATQAITVYAATPAISGPISGSLGTTDTLCAGTKIYYSDGISGGTWESSNTSLLTVNSAGLVDAFNPGSVTLSYTTLGGTVTRNIVVVPNIYSTITGPSTACTAQSISLTDSNSGGTWSSNATAIATINPTSGVLTGVANGSVTITYSNSFGTCYRTKAISVNGVTPTGIAGTSTLCTGDVTSLTNTVGGGTWTSSSISVATINSSGVTAAVSAGTVTMTYAIGGCIATKAMTVSVNPVHTISGSTAGCIGQSIMLTDSLSGGTWSSSNSAVLTVNPLSGVATGVSNGTAVITYNVGTGVCYKTANITIGGTNPSAIAGSSAICTGNFEVLTDTVSGGVWATSSSTVASINSTTGLLAANAPGTANITYTIGGCVTTKAVTVNTNMVPVITGASSGCIGQVVSLADSTTGGLWSTSNSSLATVDPSAGSVTGVTSGTVVITYNVGSGVCYKTHTMTIGGTAPAAIVGSTSACVGNLYSLSDVSTGGTWSTSSSTIASINSAGVMDANHPGTATITYSVAGCLATATVTVNANPGVITGAASVCTSSTTTLADTTLGGSWHSSNGGVASIDSVLGVVTGINAGSAVVTYSTPAGCFKTMSFVVNATPAAIVGANTVCTGITTSLTDSLSGGSWTSGSSTVASVSVAGVVTGVGAGSTSISYTKSGCRVMLPITVNASPTTITGIATICSGGMTTLYDAATGGSWSSSNTALATIGSTGIVSSISAGNPMITYTIGSGCYKTTTLTINAMPTPVAGSAMLCMGVNSSVSDSLPGGTWTSAMPAIATINGSGLITPIAVGTSTISYSRFGCVRSVIVTVNAVPASIGGSAIVCAGSMTTLMDSTTGGTWTSSNTSIATIDPSAGVVTGVSGGAPMITYMLATGCYKTDHITVNAAPAPIGGITSVCLGVPVTLTDATSGGTWTSGNTSDATIDPTEGIINGLASGVVSMSYTLESTGCSTSAMITVNPAVSAIIGGAEIMVGAVDSLVDSTMGGTWISDNGSIASIDPSTGVVTGMSAGTANIYYTLPTGCSATLALTVDAPARFGHSSTGNTFNGNVANSYSFYPNPSDGNIVISQSVVVDESASVSVINSVGQTVYCSMLNFVGGSSPLNIANVPAGVYIIVLSDDHSAKQSFRMVIEK